MQPGSMHLSPLLLWLLYAHTSADLPLCKEVRLILSKHLMSKELSTDLALVVTA